MGGLTRLDDDGRTGVTGNDSSPIDMALTRSGKLLYALGSQTMSAFYVAPSGALIPLPGVSGLPVGANGLAAR